MSYVIQLTHNNGVEMVTPKYFTGKMLERWPEYLRDPGRARVFEDRAVAVEGMRLFRLAGFDGEVTPYSEVAA